MLLLAGKMDGSRAEACVALEREISSLLSRWEPQLIKRLDAALDDCAAEALRLSVECVRLDQGLDAALESKADSRAARERPRELYLQRKRLGGQLCRLESLMGSLRLHRDRIAPLRASRR